MGVTTTSLFELLHRATQVSAAAYAIEHAGHVALTLSQHFVLSAIEKNEGASQTALVAASGIDRSTLSGILERLQKQGFITRKRVRTDARIYAVKITEGGKLQLDKARVAVETAEQKLLAAIPPNHISNLLQQLQSIVEKAATHKSSAEFADPKGRL